MRRANNGLLLLLSILVGVILGGLIGEILGTYIPLLNYGKSIGIQNFTLDLSILKLTFGFTMTLNLAGIIGIILSIILFKKL